MESSSQLASWSQAFEDYSIVQTRAIEKQLRSDIALNKQKLRNLVGGSYRELLATAEQIVTLDGKTAAAEHQISELGRNCKPKEYSSSRGNTSKHSDVAKLSLLHRCGSCIASCLKAGQIILAAKLLAVSRLLHTYLSKQEHPPKILDALLEQLSRSRRQLLRRIDRRLDDATIEQAELTDVICAFCLATSSSCNDAIHHFQHRRLGQIRHSAQGSHGDHQHTVKTFKYYIHSLRTTKLLLGQDVPRALNRLQQTAILQDFDVLRLEHLNLSSLRILMPTEIQAFTPYIKKSELSEDDASKLLEKWSQEAFTTVQCQLTTHLKTLDSTSSAFQLRQDLLSAWLQSCFSTPTHIDIVESLRKTLNEHIGSLLESQVSSLTSVATQIIKSAETICDDQTTKSSPTAMPSIWSPTIVTTPIMKGATPFLTTLRTHALGNTPTLVSTSTSLSTWCASILHLRQSITTLTKIRWQDVLEEPDADDEDASKLIIQQLTTEDPSLFSTNLETALSSTIATFQATVFSFGSSTTSPEVALHLLRSLRSASLHLTALPSADTTALQSSIPHLHNVLANSVTNRLDRTMSSSPSYKNISVDQLPDNFPTPSAFATLRTLCKIMLEVGGTDTWTRDAVGAVKGTVKQKIFVEGVERDRYVRSGFDEVYLQTALGGEMNGETEEGIRKAAVEYWGRTRLLFGVLDP
jgi:conserved oligomeric Golgi complex subunit 1